MRLLSAWLAAMTLPVLLWHECGEDLGVFCYRIGLGAFAAVRSRGLVPLPVRNSVDDLAARNHSACSTLSFTFSAHSTTQKGSRNSSDREEPR